MGLTRSYLCSLGLRNIQEGKGLEMHGVPGLGKAGEVSRAEGPLMGQLLTLGESKTL